MTRTRALLPLGFIFLTVACGGYTGDRPSPPPVPAEPLAKAAKTAEAELPTTWYENYDLGNVVVKMDAGVGENESEHGADAGNRVPYENPDLRAYRRRLQVLREEQTRLLRENAVLRAQASLAPHAKSRTSRELVEMQSWLAQLSAGQAEVVSQTQTVVKEHGALLTLLNRSSPE